MLTALSALGSEHSAPTEKTTNKISQFLDHYATQEDAVIMLEESDMVLAVHSDAGYLNELKAQRRAGRHFFLSNNEEFPPSDGAMLSIAQIIKMVMLLAVEAELRSLYINAKEAKCIQQTLEEIWHKQQCMPIFTDNMTAEGVISSRIQ